MMEYSLFISILVVSLVLTYFYCTLHFGMSPYWDSYAVINKETISFNRFQYFVIEQYDSKQSTSYYLFIKLPFDAPPIVEPFHCSCGGFLHTYHQHFGLNDLSTPIVEYSNVDNIMKWGRGEFIEYLYLIEALRLAAEMQGTILTQEDVLNLIDFKRYFNLTPPVEKEQSLLHLPYQPVTKKGKHKWLLNLNAYIKKLNTLSFPHLPRFKLKKTFLRLMHGLRLT